MENERLTIAEPRETQWYETAVRPLVAADDGMLVVGRTGSAWFVGRVVAGTRIEPLPTASDVAPIAASAVVVYTLLDPPVRLR